MRRFLFALFLWSLASSEVRAERVEGFGWSIDVPAHCAKRVKVTRVPAYPVYDAAAIEQLKRDPMMALKPVFWNLPEHVHFDLSPCFGGKSDWTALRVLPRDEFESILDEPGRPKRMLAQDFVRLSQWIASGRALRRWPFPPFLDASLELPSAVEPLAFGIGKGMRLMTMVTLDSYIPHPDSFDYIFQGLSSGGRCYVLMIVPLHIPALPAEDVSEYMGFSESSMGTDVVPRRQFQALVRKELESASTEIRPRLAGLDAVAQSLQGRCDADWLR